ncbi:MAG: hypothetical protein CM1200mP10_21670 [Candidatus Neomarinimicrobiota bacterium]|nr:MAG: hypothetical protein CM1200mP10_21670 [Candidatus Neomarinimicrobiota bacterium]
MIRLTDFRARYNGTEINIPHTAVIGTDSFDEFMKENNLWADALSKKKTKKYQNYSLIQI